MGDDKKQDREQAIKELISKHGIGRSQAIRMLDQADAMVAKSAKDK